MSTEKQKILVTGASTGFGRLIVKTLAEEGHTVFASMRAINGKNAEHATSLAKWGSDNGHTINLIELDVALDDSVHAAAETILQHTGGRIDVIVNNAGVYSNGLQEAFTADDYKHVFDVNVFGPARVNNQFLPAMRKARSGLIIQISSVLGRTVVPFQGVYNATKWAVEALSENLHYELAPLGIESVIVQPGPIFTELFGKILSPSHEEISLDYGEPFEYFKQFGETFTKIMSADNVPNQPQQVADAVSALIAMPQGERPLRTVVDHMMGGTTEIMNETGFKVQKGILNSLGLAGLLSPKADSYR